MTPLYALALSAGAIAAVNPCAFGLLPAYVGAFARATPPEAPLRVRVAQAFKTSAAVTTGFMIVFFSAGVLLEGVSAAFRRRLPYITLAIGLIVIIGGIRTLFGKPFRLALPVRSFSKPGTGTSSMVAYGMTFALASFSCTVGPFLALVAVARDQSFVTSIGAYVVYSWGMGTVVALVAITTATLRSYRLPTRRVTRIAPRLTAILMFLSGAYAVWYARWELLVYSGNLRSDPIVDRVDLWRNTLANTIDANLATIVIAIAGIAVATIVAAWTHRRSARTRSRQPGNT